MYNNQTILKSWQVDDFVLLWCNSKSEIKTVIVCIIFRLYFYCKDVKIRWQWVLF